MHAGVAVGDYASEVVWVLGGSKKTRDRTRVRNAWTEHKNSTCLMNDQSSVQPEEVDWAWNVVGRAMGMELVMAW